MSATEHTARANARGIAFVLASMALFVASDGVVKVAGETLPPTQIMALRGVMAVALTGTVVAMRVPPAFWRLAWTPLVIVRAALEAVVAVLFLIALPHLALADITAIQQVTPLVLTILSATILGEQVGWRRWSAVAAGFLGVLLVIQPSADGPGIYALSALACAALVAVRDLITRRLDPSAPTALVTFTTTLAVCLTGFAGAPLEAWAAPGGYELSLLTASAVLVTLANVFVIRGFRDAEISVVAPFRYAGVLWAILLGYAVWGHIPNFTALCGAAILVASGLYVMHREALRRRKPVPV